MSLARVALVLLAFAPPARAALRSDELRRLNAAQAAAFRGVVVGDGELFPPFIGDSVEVRVTEAERGPFRPGQVVVVRYLEPPDERLLSGQCFYELGVGDRIAVWGSGREPIATGYCGIRVLWKAPARRRWPFGVAAIAGGGVLAAVWWRRRRR